MKQILTLLLISGIYSISKGQVIIRKDPAIEKMISLISPDSLQSYVNKLVSFGTRNTLSSQSDKNRGIGAARNWVLKRFRQYGLEAYIDSFLIPADNKRVDNETMVGNVVAKWRGADTSDRRIFMMSAHLDNMRGDVMDRINDAPGANDDASGIAAMLECARVLNGSGLQGSILFVAFSGEEQGLLGSYAMAAKAKREHSDIVAILNNDIMGSNNSSETRIIDNTRVRVFSEGLPAADTEKNAKRIRQLGLENDGPSRQLARYVKEMGERYVDNAEVVMIYRNDRFLRGGDHTPFVESGFTAVRITEMNENYFHQHQDVKKENGVQYGDLPEFMDFEYLRKNAAINLAVICNLAKAPSFPLEVAIDVSRLSNQTTLRWLSPKYGNLKGYYVLIRETTSSVWQRKIFTSETEIILPLSKDNYFFAVQSVNENGNESLPVIPAIKR